ncbi:MAG: hypothetical protein ACXAB2_06750 [Candidatus Hodarchaeales archaeon]|jgi:hypothetical protein
MDDGTEVKCLKCGNIWVTRAKKKAICTVGSCKSTKVIVTDTGEKYNLKSAFVTEQEKARAEKVREPFEELKTELEESDEKFKEEKGDIFSVLFEKDGKTPKATDQGIKDVFKGLPKPSPVLVSTVQNLSVMPARLFGAYWLMSQEEAEIIAGAAIPIFRELGLRVDKISARWLFLGAILMYILPRLLQAWFARRAARSGDSMPPEVDFSQAEVGNVDKNFEELNKVAHGIASRSKIRKAVDEQVAEFRRDYGDSLDEQGNDQFKDRRSIRKPQDKE